MLRIISGLLELGPMVATIFVRAILLQVGLVHKPPLRPSLATIQVGRTFPRVIYHNDAFCKCVPSLVAVWLPSLFHCL